MPAEKEMKTVTDAKGEGVLISWKLMDKGEGQEKKRKDREKKKKVILRHSGERETTFRAKSAWCLMLNSKKRNVWVDGSIN